MLEVGYVWCGEPSLFSKPFSCKPLNMVSKPRVYTFSLYCVIFFNFNFFFSFFLSRPHSSCLSNKFKFLGVMPVRGDGTKLIVTNNVISPSSPILDFDPLSLAELVQSLSLVVGWYSWLILFEVVAGTLCGSQRQVLGVANSFVRCCWVFFGTAWVSPAR